MTPADEDLSGARDIWNLVEYEKHLNVIQAGIRALASAWLLAAFSAIGFVLKRSSGDPLVLPEQWLVAVVCTMGSFGIMLLWVLDLRVYHSLLNAVFVVGLRKEYEDSSVPPVHTMMMASTPTGSLKRRMRHFYAGPVVALGLTALAVTTHHTAALDGPVLSGDVVALFALSALALTVPLVLMFRADPDPGLVQLGYKFDNGDFDSMLAADDYVRVLRRYPARSPRKPEWLAVEQCPSNRAVDGSTVTPLLRFPGEMSTAIWRLDPGQVSATVSLRTLDEIWYVLSGQGQMWLEGTEEPRALRPGVVLSLPRGTVFQFRARDEPLLVFGVTAPPYPIGSRDAVEVHRGRGPWLPSIEG